ncbi:MazG nucleotide pyrophosphohydrolase domain-containing protein [Mycobacteroides abscessus]|uniref:NTP pyrophosphohydrolase MazG putative catalytic core domain-containing protein n=1 Tax=Mycobacteroides abscessus TaxID=36809 RepID=A0A0U0ZSY7_9MYCO|nr:MazG nucleotide pyrophosphohydrolase domain-containing protein [Mycobacteroides abscessus]CPV66507.1 Uncharacterised protein [Mycobacteroides abscessus]
MNNEPTQHLATDATPCGEKDLAHTLAPLDVLAAAVGAHLDRLGIARVNWVRVTKVSEEAGEVVGALIDLDQNRGAMTEVLDELGDVFLSALGAANQLGVNPSEVIAARWETVARRSASPEA